MERKGNASDQKRKQMLKIVRRKIGCQHFPGMNAAPVFYRHDDLAVQYPSIGSVLNFFLRLDVPVGLPIFVTGFVRMRTSQSFNRRPTLFFTATFLFSRRARFNLLSPSIPYCASPTCRGQRDVVLFVTD